MASKLRTHICSGNSCSLNERKLISSHNSPQYFVTCIYLSAIDTGKECTGLAALRKKCSSIKRILASH